VGGDPPLANEQDGDLFGDGPFDRAGVGEVAGDGGDRGGEHRRRLAEGGDDGEGGEQPVLDGIPGDSGLPGRVVGPVDRQAFARLAAVRRAEAVGATPRG